MKYILKIGINEFTYSSIEKAAMAMRCVVEAEHVSVKTESGTELGYPEIKLVPVFDKPDEEAQ